MPRVASVPSEGFVRSRASLPWPTTGAALQSIAVPDRPEGRDWWDILERSQDDEASEETSLNGPALFTVDMAVRATESFFVGKGGDAHSREATEVIEQA